MSILNKRKMSPKLQIYFLLISIAILTGLLLNYVVPVLAGYPPFSEETSFILSLEPITHAQQYSLMAILSIVIAFIFIKISFKKVFLFLKQYSLHQDIDYSLISSVRIQCLKIPRNFFILQMCTTSLILFTAASSSNVPFDSFTKMVIIYISIVVLITVIAFIVLKNILSTIITLTYNSNPIYADSLYKHSSFSKNISLQLVPFFIAIMGTLSMISYSKIVDEIGKSNYQYYQTITQSFNKEIVNSNNISEIKQVLESLPLNNQTDTYFIISPYDIITSDGKELSPFFIQYTKTFSEKTQGKTYDFYGSDYQGYVINAKDFEGNNWYIGFKYSISTLSIINYLIIIDLILIFAYVSLITIWSRSISSNITKLYEKMNDIANKNNIDSFDVMPILSTDEIGQLSYTLNKIRDLTKNNVEQIHASQDMIVEKERLASLGQMIGGIAHNLKTPIMSIAGAAEALTDLVKEYDSSVGDSEVTNEDHHEIAKDMTEWIEKTRTHLSYMSDVITAIKGQAVAFSDQAIDKFTIEELVKHINILMKHELSNALINLNVNITISENTEIKGNINSLVQVINNIISNAIQAYNGKQNENIDFTISSKDKKLVIKIEDYAGGLPDNVKEKLFKEMVTTKGKAGTGLRIVYVIF